MSQEAKDFSYVAVVVLLAFGFVASALMLINGLHLERMQQSKQVHEYYMQKHGLKAPQNF